MANELEREVKELRTANEILKKGEIIFRHRSEDNGEPDLPCSADRPGDFSSSCRHWP
jgi:transposase-like protein